MLQDRFNVEVTALVEHAAEATAFTLAKEVYHQLGAAERPRPPASSQAGTAQTAWICPAPISVKMRLFCLPYAGGVSENVFGRCSYKNLTLSPIAGLLTAAKTHQR